MNVNQCLLYKHEVSVFLWVYFLNDISGLQQNRCWQISYTAEVSKTAWTDVGLYRQFLYSAQKQTGKIWNVKYHTWENVWNTWYKNQKLQIDYSRVVELESSLHVPSSTCRKQACGTDLCNDSGGQVTYNLIHPSIPRGRKHAVPAERPPLNRDIPAVYCDCWYVAIIWRDRVEPQAVRPHKHAGFQGKTERKRGGGSSAAFKRG